MRLAALLLALGWGRVAADLSKQAYVADGATTYCRTLSDDYEVSILKLTDATTAGKCPLALSMGVTVKSYTMKSTVFEISWSASLAPNSSKILYPVKLKNGKASVILPTVEACLLGSNCASFGDIIGAKPVGNQPTDLELDPASGKAIAMSKYTLELPSTGNYVVLADATVSGRDDMVSNTVFQHVRATSDGSTAPGTIKPPRAGFASVDTSTTTAPTPSQSRAVSAQVSATPLASTTPVPTVNNSTVASAGTSHTSATNALVVVALAVVGLILAGVLILVRKKREKNEDLHANRPESMQAPARNHRRHPGPPGPTEEKPIPAGKGLGDSDVMTHSLDSYGTRTDRTGNAFLVLNSTREDSFGSVAILDSSMISSFSTNTNRAGVDFAQSTASSAWDESTRSGTHAHWKNNTKVNFAESTASSTWDESTRSVTHGHWKTKVDFAESSASTAWDDSTRSGPRWDETSRTVDSNRLDESSASNRWNDTSRSGQSNYWEESRRSDVSNHWVDTSRTDAGTDWLDSSRSGLDISSRRGNDTKKGKTETFSF